MGKRRFALIAVVAAALVLVAGIAFTGGSTIAQTGTPESGMGMSEGPHPAHIHAGTCATLGEVVFPLNDVTQGDTMGTPMAGDMGSMASPMAGMGDMGSMASPMAGMGMGEVVAQSTTNVAAAVADIISGGHAINVHESAENIQNYIACGDITGTPTDNTLTIALNELNGSGYQGMAMLTDNGDGTTTVTVMLMRTMGGSMATPTS